MHEAQMHRSNCFVTLTYDDDHYHPSLNYGDFQRFMDRFRLRLRRERLATQTVSSVSTDSRTSVRFFMSGEYGDLRSRPHFHVLLFNCGFTDLSAVGVNLYRSKYLESLWPFGFSSVGTVTYESALYVAKYVNKRVYGRAGEAFYRRVDLGTGESYDVVPEFAHMSLKPGIGSMWFDKYWRDVYQARDGVVLKGGRTVKAPRYYDEKLKKSNELLFEDKEYERYLKGLEFAIDCTPERLAVREQIAMSNLKRLKEKL